MIIARLTVKSLRVRAPLQQQPDHLGVPAATRHVQRRRSVLVRRADKPHQLRRQDRAEQLAGRGNVPARRGPVQGRAAGRVQARGLGPGAQQQLQSLFLPRPRRLVQRRISGRGAAVHRWGTRRGARARRALSSAMVHGALLKVCGE